MLDFQKSRGKSATNLIPQKCKNRISQEKNAKNPVKVDFKDLIKHKSLEQLDLRFDEDIGTRLFNVQEILNLKVKKIKIPDEKFKTEDLEKLFDKIGTKREKFLLDINKKTKGEKIIVKDPRDKIFIVAVTCLGFMVLLALYMLVVVL